MEKKTITVQRYFKATPERIWQALTNKDEMKAWYFDLKEFKAEVGFEFEFVGGHEDGVQYLHHCKITEVIPFQKLTYSWRYDGYPGLSYVTFELFPKQGQTLLVLTHSGLDSFPQGNPDFARHNFEAGWDSIINDSLQHYLEKNYQTQILLDATPEKVFENISMVPLWWTVMFEGKANGEGASFTVRFGDAVYKTMVVESWIPHQKIIWKVVDSLIDIPELQGNTEWTGTQIIWEITMRNGKTLLQVTHKGLTPQVACYDVCQNGWSNFLISLESFITTGQGHPFVNA